MSACPCLRARGREKEAPMLKTVRIHNAASPQYSSFHKAYVSSFPKNERRGEASQRAAFRDPRYRLDAWLDGDDFIGFMDWWDFASFRYLEHVAVSPEFRSAGYGGRILRQWLAASEMPVLLEIEDVVDGPTRRRLDFYQRLGFSLTAGAHTQPVYQGSGPAPVMRTLSWPSPISECQRRDFISLLHSEVWADLRP